MSNLLKYTTAMLLMFLIKKSVNAQQYYANICQAADAAMVQIQGNNHMEHTLQGATIIFPNGSDELNLSLNIPLDAVQNKTVSDADVITPGYLFQLKVNIDPNEIQEMLTSGKIFLTHGFLTLHSITKPVIVQYIPQPSGTEEDGNFNINMSIQFSAANFNLDTSDNNTQFVININNAKVNRV